MSLTMPRHINKLLAMLLLLGAIGAFGLSQRTSYEVQQQGWLGAPVGEPRTIYVSRGDRVGFIAAGAVCMAGCLYFVARIRRDDTHR